MELKVEKASKIEGVVKAPPSKSYTHRALLVACLAEGESCLRDPLYSADTMATLEACQALGRSDFTAFGEYSRESARIEH